MASATPDLWLPSQLVLVLVPNCTASLQWHVCEQLAQGCTRKHVGWGGGIENGRPDINVPDKDHLVLKLVVYNVGWVMGRASGRKKAGCWFVDGDDLTGASHVL